MLQGARKIAIVNGVCVKYDAISDSVIAEYKVLSRIDDWQVKLFAYKCDYGGVNCRVVRNTTDLLLDGLYLGADVIIYHFGIYYPLFDTLLIGNGRARRCVRFHGITPRQLLPEKDHSTIDRSFTQLVNLTFADRVWCDSEFNRRDLTLYGVPEGKTATMNLAVPVPSALAQPSRAPITDGLLQLVYIGRFVQSKGITDLIRAVALARDQGADKFRLVLIGNSKFSDGNYIETIRRIIVDYSVQTCVEFHFNVSDEQKSRFLSHASAFVTATYHEGFCIPIVEALLHGCYVIAYDAGNVPFVTNGLGTLVPTGDVNALGRAFANFITKWHAAVAANREPLLDTGYGVLSRSEFQHRARSYAAAFSPERFAEHLLAELEGVLDSNQSVVEGVEE